MGCALKGDNMSDDNTLNPEVVEDPAPEEQTETSASSGAESIEKLVEQRVSEALKPIKEKLNKAYSERDEVKTRLTEYERKEKEIARQKLLEEGKLKEVYELQLEEERAARRSLEERNTQLSRDVEVRGILASLPFRNDRANEMAYQEIVGQLTRDEYGNWTHKSGVPIKDFVEAFSQDDKNSFLFKVKANSGGGGRGPSKVNEVEDGRKKSLFNMSQDEVLKLAEEGKLRRG
jgi:hypothetical protein